MLRVHARRLVQYGLAGDSFVLQTLNVVRKQEFSVLNLSTCRSTIHLALLSLALLPIRRHDLHLHARRTRTEGTSALAPFNRYCSLLCCCCILAPAATSCWLWAASLMAFLISAPRRFSALLRSCCSARKATLHKRMLLISGNVIKQRHHSRMRAAHKSTGCACWGLDDVAVRRREHLRLLH